ncbi:MAG: peptidoglycan-binding protein [Burkholderiaceae bacterium]|nr:peptidoglycan-binding protein [Burkholderiaceae bacterium]
MSLLNLFKLEKLRIEAFLDVKRKRPADPPRMEVMFNPTTYKRSHAVAYTERRKGVTMQGWPSRYAYTAPGDLSLKLVFDGTGVNKIGLERLIDPPSVKKDIQTFEKLCLRMNGDIHQPNFLVVRWGDFSFPGRLHKLDITYTVFDEAGDPLRAELDVAFVEDVASTTGALAAAKSSPDLTHVRIAKAGDTLPLLCQAIYGSSRHYLRVAQHNALDDFRRLEPGQRIVFPPLDGGAPS